MWRLAPHVYFIYFYKAGGVCYQGLNYKVLWKTLGFVTVRVGSLQGICTLESVYTVTGKFWSAAGKDREVTGS